jgi:hypothetical protein
MFEDFAGDSAMKTILFTASTLFLASAGYAEETTTEFVADPIVITAEVDSWETDPAFQLPVGAPTKLVDHRVALTKAFAFYTNANLKLRSLMDALPFEASAEQMDSVEMAREQVAAALAALVDLESEYVQEKSLFEGDQEDYAIQNALQDSVAAK